MEKICDSLGLNEWNCRVVGTLDGVKVSYTGGNEVISGPGGTFRYEFDEAKTVDFKGVKEGYFTERVSVFLSKNMMPVTIEMEKINLFPAEPGSGQQHTTNRRLPNIYFDYDSASIRPDQIARMDSISMVLIDNPGLVIEIGSHADERGGNRYNDKLSARRSNSIYKYLVDKGINPDRMLEMGYGKRRPVFKNVSRRDPQAEYKHQMNRRTEFKVLALSGSAESFRPKGKRGR
jgi:outer membrane protein OmpA-like peptidoglycan-associated protein